MCLAEGSQPLSNFHRMSTKLFDHNRAVRVLALIEATTVTGPAKNLLEFCRRCRKLGGGPKAGTFELTIVTFHRGAGAHGSAQNAFVTAARAAGITVEVIAERFRFDPRVLWALARIVKKHRPDIIQ